MKTVQICHSLMQVENAEDHALALVVRRVTGVFVVFDLGRHNLLSATESQL